MPSALDHSNLFSHHCRGVVYSRKCQLSEPPTLSQGCWIYRQSKLCHSSRSSRLNIASLHHWHRKFIEIQSRLSSSGHSSGILLVVNISLLANETGEALVAIYGIQSSISCRIYMDCKGQEKRKSYQDPQFHPC